MPMPNEDCYKNGIGSVEKCMEGINACVKVNFKDQEVVVAGKVEQIKAGTARGCAPRDFEQLIEDGVCKEMNIGDLTPDVTPRVCFCKSELCNGSGKFNDSIITISILVFVSYLMK